MEPTRKHLREPGYKNDCLPFDGNRACLHFGDELASDINTKVWQDLPISIHDLADGFDKVFLVHDHVHLAKRIDAGELPIGGNGYTLVQGNRHPADHLWSSSARSR
jgi:hypothetical protein